MFAHILVLSFDFKWSHYFNSMTKFSEFFFSFSLQQWELIVLNKLKWNISSVTPLDFLEHLLVRLPINKQHTDVSQIKKHAQAFISLAARGKFTDKVEFIFVLSNSGHYIVAHETGNEIKLSMKMKSSILFSVLMHTADSTSSCHLFPSYARWPVRNPFLCIHFNFYIAFNCRPSKATVKIIVNTAIMPCLLQVDWVIWIFEYQREKKNRSRCGISTIAKLPGQKYYP